MATFSDDQHCFVCGPANPAGLQLQFRGGESPLTAEAEVTFPDHLQGWRNTVHGGLLATVMDEAMIKAAAVAGIKCVTAELTAKYKKPVTTGVPYKVSGRVVDCQGRLVLTESSIRDAAGEVHALGTGKMFQVR